MWAPGWFVSCFDASFHPLGVITEEEWRDEESRISNLPNSGMRDAQAANLHSIKDARDKALQKYKADSKADPPLTEASKTLKGYGVRLLTLAMMSKQ